jgi:hypothetical protein
LTVTALTLLFNPLYLPIIRGICRRSAADTTVGNVYPWAFQLKGLGCVWVGDYWALREAALSAWISWFALGLTILAGVGLLRFCAGRLLALWQSPQDRVVRRSVLLAIGLVGTATLPLLVVARGWQYPYQFAKLFLSVGPVLVLGVALCVSPSRWPWLRGTSLVPLLLLLGTVVTGTVRLARHSADPSLGAAWHSGHHVTGHPDWCEMAKVLKSAPKLNLILAAGEGIWFNCWPGYFARAHRVWYAYPVINDGCAIDTRFPQSKPVLDLDTVPAENTQLLTCYWDPMCTQVGGDARRERTNNLFQFWKLGPGPVALRLRVENQTFLSYTAPNVVRLDLGAKPASMDFWTNRPGLLQMTAQFLPEAPLPGGVTLRLHFLNAANQRCSVKCKPGKQSVVLPLPAGKSLVRLECSAGSELPTAPTLVSVRDLVIQFTDPATAGEQERSEPNPHH